MRADTPLRILHVTHPSFVGGLERVVHALAAGHRRRGLDVRVLTVVPEGQRDMPFVDLLRSVGVPVILLPLPDRAYLRERREIARVCDDFRPHVLHTHGDRGDVLASPIGRRLGIATVVTDHGTSMMPGMGRVYEFLQRRTYRRFAGVVVVSRDLQERARRDRVREERIHFVPNAWQPIGEPLARAEAQARLGVESSRPVVGWVARMIPVKDPELFVRAAARCDFPGAQFVMIGDGPERPRMEDLSRSLGLSDRLRFVGAIAHAAPLFSAFDCWVLSSRSEGTPIALFEALAAGVSVVATAVGEVPEVLRGDGITVPVGDAEALAAAIRTTLSDLTGASTRAAAAGARVARDYAAEPWLKRYEAIYAKVVGQED